MPRVSVVLPTYNRARWLPESIASVRAQTCTDWELVLVDDGSTDGSIGACPVDSPAMKGQCRRRAYRAWREFMALGRSRGALVTDLAATAHAFNTLRE